MKGIVAWTLCLLLTALCAPAAARQIEEGEPFTIAVAADLHVNPANRDTGLINPLVPYNLEITDALLWDAAGSGADVLLLCGDITNQGRLVQHEALTEKLRRAEESGLTVYVLPGNHDIGETGTDAFARLYEDFGYGEAYSRDPASLSSSVRVGSYLLLLLDTNGYTGQRYEASLSEATLAWMQGQLELAREKGWPVIAAGHYPLLTGYSTPFVHKDRAAGLLESYGVQLYLAGHLHKRCVAVQGELAELVVDQAIAYPCCYAMLEVDGESCRYTPRQIAVSDWAAQSGTYDPSLLGFDACQTELEQARCRGIVERLRRDRDVGAEALAQAEDFFWQLMDSRAHGTVSEHADALRAHPGYGLLVELAVGTIYNSWIPSVIESAVPYTTGFLLRDHRMMSPDGSE